MWCNVEDNYITNFSLSGLPRLAKPPNLNSSHKWDGYPDCDHSHTPTYYRPITGRLLCVCECVSFRVSEISLSRSPKSCLQCKPSLLWPGICEMFLMDVAKYLTCFWHTYSVGQLVHTFILWLVGHMKNSCSTNPILRMLLQCWREWGWPTKNGALA